MTDSEILNGLRKLANTFGVASLVLTDTTAEVHLPHIGSGPEREVFIGDTRITDAIQWGLDKCR